MSKAPRKGAFDENPAGELTATSFAFVVVIVMVSISVFGGISLTATDRLPFPFSLWGMYSSSTA
jgi:hypothetical protein